MPKCEFCNSELVEMEGDKDRAWMCRNQVCLNEKEYSKDELPEQTWNIWVLSEGDIEFVCKKIGVDFEKLTNEQKEEITRIFKKGIEEQCNQWEEGLEFAIYEVLKYPNIG